MTDAERDVDVRDNPDEGRYEVRLDGELAGFAEYQLRPGRILFTHTEVDEAYEGHGLGSRLAAGALDGARERGLTVTPLCSFIRRYVERHDEYADLVADGA